MPKSNLRYKFEFARTVDESLKDMDNMSKVATQRILRKTMDRLSDVRNMQSPSPSPSPSPIKSKIREKLASVKEIDEKWENVDPAYFGYKMYLENQTK